VTRVVVVVQARTGSTRLPGKVLKPVAGAPLLMRMLERVLAARTPTEVVVATTRDADDEPIRALARAAGVRCVSGHPTDLLDRHLQAAREANADVVVKVPSDCPLIDPAVVDHVIGRHLAAPDADFVSNLLPPTWPDGNDVEVMPREVLETAAREAEHPLEREHTTPFIWARPERFRLVNVRWASGADLSRSHRFTIDYPEDYELVRGVYDGLWTPARPMFGVDEIIAFLDANPALASVNARHRGESWLTRHAAEWPLPQPGDQESP